MKVPVDPREILAHTDQAIRVRVAPGKTDAYHPVNAEWKSIEFDVVLLRVIDTRNPDAERVANKIEIAPGVWIIVALIDKNNEAWIEDKKKALITP